MEEFLDSAGIVADGGALAERLRQDGYLCIKGLLPREDVLRVRQMFLEAVAAAGWLRAGAKVDEAIADGHGLGRRREKLGPLLERQV
jgi:hypothetical protein